MPQRARTVHRKGHFMSFGHTPECRMSELTGNRAHCSSCHKTFRGDAGFDKHRVGSYRPEDPRRCMTTEEMLEAGMVQNAKGLWVTEAWDPTVTHSERKKGRDASPPGVGSDTE